MRALFNHRESSGVGSSQVKATGGVDSSRTSQVKWKESGKNGTTQRGEGRGSRGEHDLVVGPVLHDLGQRLQAAVLNHHLGVGGVLAQRGDVVEHPVESSKCGLWRVEVKRNCGVVSVK